MKKLLPAACLLLLLTGCIGLDARLTDLGWTPERIEALKVAVEELADSPVTGIVDEAVPAVPVRLGLKAIAAICAVAAGCWTAWKQAQD